MEIIIKNYDKEIRTTDTTYSTDLLKYKNQINNFWHWVEIEYIDGTHLFDRITNDKNGFSPRRVVIYNGRTIYASWTLDIEIPSENTFDKIMKYLDKDFKSL